MVNYGGAEDHRGLRQTVGSKTSDLSLSDVIQLGNKSFTHAVKVS